MAHNICSSQVPGPGAHTICTKMLRNGLWLLLAWLTPAMAASAAGEDPYDADFDFLGGSYFDDAFAGNSSANGIHRRGDKVAMQANGDIVVAARVSHLNGDGNSRSNLGLVRYTQSGVRKIWNDVQPAYGHYGNQYVIYPNIDDPMTGNISALIATSDKLVVVLNEPKLTGPLLLSQHAYVYVFSNEGQFLSRRALDDDPDQHVMARDAVHFQSDGDHLVVVATKVLMGNTSQILRRFRIQADGQLVPLTDMVSVIDTACDDPTRTCTSRAITVAHRGEGLSPMLYLALAIRNQTPPSDHDITVVRIDMDGVRDPAWDPMNRIWAVSESGGLNDVPVGVVVHTTGSGTVAAPFVDTLYVAAQVDDACMKHGAIVRLNHAGDSATITRFGGHREGGPCPESGWHDTPLGLTMDGDLLAVVGQRDQIALTTEHATHASIAIIDRNNMAFRQLVPLTYQQLNGENRHTALAGIAAAGNERFAVTGWARWRNTGGHGALGGKNVAITTMLAPSRLFSDGFESP